MVKADVSSLQTKMCTPLRKNQAEFFQLLI